MGTLPHLLKNKKREQPDKKIANYRKKNYVPLRESLNTTDIPCVFITMI